jgi:hypothetical protein
MRENAVRFPGRAIVCLDRPVEVPAERRVWNSNRDIAVHQ